MESAHYTAGYKIGSSMIVVLLMIVGLYGFGAIGQLVARKALELGFDIAAVIDINPSLVGRDIGEILGLEERVGVRVSSDPKALKGVDVVLHATGSYLDRVYGQLVESIEAGADVVSTCETLAYPYYRYPDIARMLDSKAKSRGVTVIGTGINPGFLLDTLAITLAAPLGFIRRVKAVRSLDAAKRRATFQRKIGVGLKPDKVREMLEEGTITGHVGYAESVLLIADAAGIRLSRVEEGQSIVAADRPVESHGVRVDAGSSLGLTGYGAGFIGDTEVIRVEFKALVGADEYEHIAIEGHTGTLEWRSNGTPGDVGTAFVVLSVADAIVTRPPGLALMTDLTPFRFRFKV